MFIEYEIEVLNWEKYQGRKDVKHCSWFKMYPKFFGHNDFAHFSPAEQLFATFLFALCSEHSSASIRFNTTHVHSRIRVRTTTIELAVTKLEQNQTIKVISRNGRVPLERKNRKIEKEKKDLNPTPNGVGDLPLFETDRGLTNGKVIHKESGKTNPLWEAYRESMKGRYKHEPKRNATVNGQLSHLLNRLGPDDSIKVLKFYVAHNDRWYIRKGHAISACLQDAEKLFMEMTSGKKITSVTAAQTESSDHNKTVIENYLRKTQERDVTDEL